MADSEAYQERLEAVDECLDFMTKTLESAKDSMETTEKVMEDKETTIEDTKLCIEANVRTVEALKRTLEALKKSVDDDFETMDEVENSLETLKTTVNKREGSIQNGAKTYEDETNSEDAEAKIVEGMGYVDQTLICLNNEEKIEGTREDVGKNIGTEVFKNPLYTENKDGKRIEEILKAIQNLKEKEETDQDEVKCLEHCNTCGIFEIKGNSSRCSCPPIIVSLASERNKGKSELGNEMSVRPKENLEISNEEFKVDKELSVRPKERTVISNEEFKVDKEQYVRPTEKPEISNEEFKMAKDQSVRPKERTAISNEEFKVAKDQSVRLKEKLEVSNEFGVAEKKSVRPKKKRPKEEYEQDTEKLFGLNEKPKTHKGLEREADKSVLPKERPSVTAEKKFTPSWKNYVHPKQNSYLTSQKSTKEQSVRPEEKSLGAEEKPAAPYEPISLYYQGMDNPLNAMLFSEQLIEYVLKKLGHVWPCREGARNLPPGSVSMRFSKVIGEAMIAIIDSNIENIAESYKQLVEKNVHKIDSFRTEVCVTATFFFDEGFSYRNFLVYAAQLAGLSAFYFANGNTQIADGSAQVLAYILNYYIYQLWFLPSSDWFNLHLEAQDLRNQIQERKIKFVLPSELTQPMSSGTEKPL